MPIVLAFSLTLVLLAQGGPCRKAVDVSGERVQSAQTGTWGGPHVQMDVGADGARLEFDCAHGATDGPLAPGDDGRFDLAGYFVVERGGPVRAGRKEKRLPARYSGRVEGQTMTLDVTLTEGGEHVGTFTLTRGRAGRLTRCL
ncbi:MAG TPA: hypothetical protein VN256_02850 [Pyrinomonadaceae bacterium]|nr:hypothetical protein [Pyrinomonadaceae bacterium]